MGRRPGVGRSGLGFLQRENLKIRFCDGVLGLTSWRTACSLESPGGAGAEGKEGGGDEAGGVWWSERDLSTLEQVLNSKREGSAFIL